MNRPHPSSPVQRPQTTLRVLGRLPYVAGPSDDSNMVAETESGPNGSPVFVADSIKRGLIYGLVALAILGATWYLVAKKSDKSELAKNGDDTWEVQPPRPDAPEAPAWNPYGEAGPSGIQSAQAQNSSGTDTFTNPAPAFRSPLGFDLPPGNGWGQPSLPETAVSYPNQASGPVNAWQQPSMVQAPTSYPAQSGLEPNQGGPAVASPFPNQPSPQTTESVPVPPWANAAGQLPVAQPAGFAADSYPVSSSQSAAQAPMSGSPAVVRNPYVVGPSPSTNDAFSNTTNPPVYPTAPATTLAGTGSYSPSGTVPMNYVAPAPNGWTTATSEQGSQQADAYLASRPSNQWATASPSSNWQAGVPYPTGSQTSAASWDQPRPYGNTPMTPAGGNQAVTPPNGGYPSSTYPQGNWNLPGGQQPAAWNEPPSVPPSAPAWNVPTGQPAQSPYPTGPGSFSPVDRSNTLPSAGGDSQVVPATYARPTPADIPMSQGLYPTTAYPSTGGQSNAANTAPAQYPSTGQTGYGLYPATTLR